MQVYFEQTEAADYIRVSETTFKRHVLVAVPCTFVGAKKVFAKEDLDQYMLDNKSFAKDRPQRKRGSASNLVKINPKAAAIAEQMGNNGKKTESA